MLAQLLIAPQPLRERILSTWTPPTPAPGTTIRANHSRNKENHHGQGAARRSRRARQNLIKEPTLTSIRLAPHNIDRDPLFAHYSAAAAAIVAGVVFAAGALRRRY